MIHERILLHARSDWLRFTKTRWSTKIGESFFVFVAFVADREVWTTVNSYAAAGDGQRFLLAERAPDPDAPPISIIVNWPALMER